MGNKLFFPAIIALALCALSACTRQTPQNNWENMFQTEPESSGDTETQYILMAHTEPEDSQTHKAAEVFRQALETASQGKMSAEIYANVALGNTQASSLILDGGVDIGIGMGPSSYLKIAQWLPVLRGMNREQVQEALSKDGALRVCVEEECAEAGVHILGLMPIQVRFLAGTRKILSPSDLKGLNVRSIPGLTGDEALWRRLGAEPQSFDPSALYLAIQQGRMDAQASSLEFFINYKLYEQERYILDTNHELYIRPLMTSASFFQSLMPEQQGWVEEAAQQMLDWVTEEQTAYEEKWTDFLIDNGVSIAHLPDNLRTEWMEAMYPVVWNNLEQRYGKDVVERVVGLLNSSQ